MADDVVTGWAVCVVSKMRRDRNLILFKTCVWERMRWNRWDLVTRVGGTDEAWLDN
jgi:hypothetical protein